jgi:hypothetical protein
MMAESQLARSMCEPNPTGVAKVSADDSADVVPLPEPDDFMRTATRALGSSCVVPCRFGESIPKTNREDVDADSTFASVVRARA